MIWGSGGGSGLWRSGRRKPELFTARRRGGEGSVEVKPKGSIIGVVPGAVLGGGGGNNPKTKVDVF